MILDTLYILTLVVVLIGIFPTYYLFVRGFGRSRRAVVEGMAELDNDVLNQLGWTPREYIGVFDLGAPFRLGWQAWGFMTQQQNMALQRVILRGLPEVAGLSDDTQRAARRYRRFVLVIGIFVVLFFIPSFIGLSRSIAEITGTPTGLWYALSCVCILICAFLPTEKFQKWPEVEVKA